MRRSLATVLALLLLVAACSRSEDSTAAAPDTTTTTTRVGVTEPDRLAVMDGPDIFTMTPDGSNRVQVTGAGIDTQPVWSPDGSQLAWSYADATGEGVATAAGLRVDLAAPPFYLSWSPDGHRIAYLLPTGDSIEFGVVDAATGEVTGRDVGDPYYFAWSPDSTMLLRHVADTLAVVDGDAEASPVADPSMFQAPGWTGDYQVYGEDTTGDPRLVARRGDTVTEVATYVGFALFLLAPGGDRLAWQAVDPNPPTGVVTARGRAQGPDLSLHVAELPDGPSVTLDAALGFYWDRQGTRLLYVTRNGDQLQWHVWDGEAVHDLDVFQPSDVFARAYMPFFDQFAQSHRFWSPAGDAFVFAGSIDGREGIWVRSLDRDAAAWVGDGDLAVWS